MALLRLTDISLAQSTAITPTTLIHIVTTADTTQFSGGSSYKAELGQLSSLFSGSPQIYTTAFTYSNNTFTIFDNSGSTFSQTVNDFTGLTINGGLSATTFSAVTIGSSGDCVDDLYVSNIHSCSPLYINPLSEGDVYVGSANTLTVDLTNERVGVGTSTPSKKLEVSNGDALIYGLTVGRGGGANSYNTVLGANALNSNTTGQNNIAIGRFSLFNNTIGMENTSIGGGSLSSNVDSNSNIAIGYYSQINLTGGTGNNVSVGNTCLNGNVDGYQNIAIGNDTLSIKQFGSDNIAIGHASQENGISGNTNISIGTQSLSYNVGDSNIGIGYLSLSANTSGSGNTAVGYSSLTNNITGNYNLTLGYNSNVGSSNLTNAIAIGYNSMVNTNDSMVLGNGVNVGIGTSSPSEKLDVSGRTKTENFTMTSGATNDYILKSDSSGNASWSPLSGITGVVNKYTITTGFTASVTQTITHNLNTNYVHCSVWDQSNDQLITAQVVRTLGNINNAVDITIATTGTYDILITG